jgi:Putative prokaryotic signal transducing protein
METEDLVEVYRAKSSVQAHLMVSELEDAGIKAMVDGDNLETGLGGDALGWSAAPRILVAASNEGRARGILKHLDQGKSAE